MSDPHFGHKNIINFTDALGTRIRPFASVEEHDETIIENCNKVVKPEDRLYLLGDIAIGRASIAQVGRLNGRKKLIKGNHDIFKLKDYIPYFDDICAYRFYPEHGIIMSHIPVHTSCLENRFKLNVHGHTHINFIHEVNHDLIDPFTGQPAVQRDARYMNVCLEHTKFAPVNFQDIIDNLKKE